MKDYIVNLLMDNLSYAYCDNCGTENCDECHRKYQSWSLNRDLACRMADKIVEKIKETPIDEL